MLAALAVAIASWGGDSSNDHTAPTGNGTGLALIHGLGVDSSTGGQQALLAIELALPPVMMRSVRY